MLVDLRAAQLLCSRLCHDLVGPAGAVNAGMELIQEDPRNAGEALTLVADSGQQIVRRLEFYRIAFGLGGEGAASLGEIRALSAGLLAEGNVTLTWMDEGVLPGPPLPATGGKLVLNLVLLGVDCLPRGGTLEVHVAALAEGLGVAMTAIGQGARLRSEVQAALQPEVASADLSARTIQGYFAQRLAEHVGTSIETSDTVDDQVRLALVLHGVTA